MNTMITELHNINKELKTEENITKMYPNWSNEYGNGVKKEIELLKKKSAILKKMQRLR